MSPGRAIAQSWWPFGKSEDPSKGLLVRFDERRDVTWPIDPRTGQRAAQLRARRGAQGGRDLRPMSRAPRRVLRRLGSGPAGCPTPMWSRRSRAGSTTPTDRCMDEVYNYGSFKQSKMFAAGVTCSDCHEPHGAKLRAPGDGVCLQCHAPDKYAAATHHHHASGRPGARLHVVPYAGAHLHGGRPAARPQLPHSAARSVGEARNAQCLQRLSRRQVGRMGGDGGRALAWAEPQGPAELRRGVPCGVERQADAASLLAAVAADRNAPAIARASALSELAPYVSPANINLARTGLSDPDPMVRIGALDMLENVPATAALAARFAAAVRSQPWRAHTRRDAAGGRSDREPTARRPRAL